MKKIAQSLLVFALISFPMFAQAVELVNPLGETDLRKLMGRVIAAGLSIAGSLALLMFMYGGFLWLTSRGDPKQITKGKEILTWTTLGIVVLFSSYVIVGAVISAITTGSATGSDR